MTTALPRILRRDEQDSLRDLRAWLDQRFGSRVRQVVLFGSRARGEGHEHSDVDVLVVVDAISSQEADETARFCGDLLTRHSVLVSPLVQSSARWSELVQRGRLIAKEIARDGVPL